MAVFLKLHMDEVMENESVIEALREWRSVQEKEGKRIGELVGYCSGVVAFLRAPREGRGG
jgi:U3 small nucleolar RNA-associated protein 21